MSAPTPQRLFVTGGRGRLAALIVAHFRAPAHAVTLFSRQGGDGFLPLAGLTEPGALAGADAVLHLAWSTLPATSERQPGAEEQQDLPYLRNLLAAIAARPAGRRPHFIFFSSGGAVYGNARDNRPSRESDDCAPIGRYGRAKLLAERLIEDTATRAGLAYTILRISNPYGFPAPMRQPQGIVPFLLNSARTGTPFSVWGDGTARKNFLYHTDFTAALGQILQVRPQGVFNVCHGESHTVNEVIAHVEETLGRKIKIVHVPANAWDVHDSLLDNAKLRAAVDWNPTVSLAEGIRRAAH